MNYPWQQPIRPLQVQIPDTDLWVMVLFIRPSTAHGWQVISAGGHVYRDDEALLRIAD